MNEKKKTDTAVRLLDGKLSIWNNTHKNQGQDKHNSIFSPLLLFRFYILFFGFFFRLKEVKVEATISTAIIAISFSRWITGSV